MTNGPTWRFWVSMGIAAAALVAGVGFHLRAHDDRSAAVLTHGIPLNVQIYSAAPGQTIAIDLSVNRSRRTDDPPLPVGEYNVDLSLPGDSPDLILVFDELPQPRDSRELAQFHKSRFGSHDVWTEYVPRVRESAPGLVVRHTFRLPDGFVDIGAGGVAARMPAVGWTQDDYQLMPAFSVDDPREPSQLRQPPTEPRDIIPVTQEAQAYGLPQNERLYWAPRRVDSTISLHGVSNYLENSSINVNLPSSGTLIDDAFVWTGGLGLAPSLQATNHRVEERRSSDEFYSGLALATVANALIAALQEMPHNWSWRKFMARRLANRQSRRRGRFEPSEVPYPPVPTVVPAPSELFTRQGVISDEAEVHPRGPMSSASMKSARRRALRPRTPMPHLGRQTRRRQ